MQSWRHLLTSIAAGGVNQVKCVCTWQISISLETDTRPTQEITWRAEEVVITRLNWSYKGHHVPYFSRGPLDYLPLLWPDADHWPHTLGCTVSQESRDKYYPADSLRTFLETVPEAFILEYMREAINGQTSNTTHSFWLVPNWQNKTNSFAEAILIVYVRKSKWILVPFWKLEKLLMHPQYFHCITHWYIIIWQIAL